jgi:hypothetical protein
MLYVQSSSLDVRACAAMDKAVCAARQPLRMSAGRPFATCPAMNTPTPLPYIVSGLSLSGVPIIAGTAVISKPSIDSSHSSATGQFAADEWSGAHGESAAEPNSHRDSFDFLIGKETIPSFDDNPIASAENFERERANSLVYLLEANNGLLGAKPIVHFAVPGASAPIAHLCEETAIGEGQTALLLARLLHSLQSVAMTDPDRHADAFRRLQQLDAELTAAGVVCPADPQVTRAVAEALTNSSADSDIQIRVNTSRHTTTTRTVFETETRGMDGLDAEQIRRLQQQLIANLG